MILIETGEAIAAPEEVLRAFWTEMNQWEVTAYRTMPPAGSGERWEKFVAEVWPAWQPIFEKYCTPKKRVHRSSGLHRSIGSPPQYDPKEEMITEVIEESPSRVVVKTLRTFPLGEYFYVLLKRGGHWCIDSRQWRDYEGKIVRGSL